MKRQSEPKAIAEWLSSPQGGMLGDDRVQRAAVLLVELERRVEQEQRFKYKANQRAEKAEDKLRRIRLLVTPASSTSRNTK